MSTPTTGEAHVDSANFLTIPNGRQWSGTVVISASAAAAIGSSAATIYPAVTVESTDATTYPSPGSIVAEVSLSTPAVNVLSLLGFAAEDSATFDVTINANTASVTLKLHFNGATGACAVATGVLV